ncbi:hypothetical protein BKA56DRAFT_622220 [Ilyonectria sp. MPI-CAGE-AT-0026]|nr:hypothetical protein BKA56DRAFT_622220 [Ilyonectria sp. MPI-CAGE-AT-0026]
MKLPTVIAKKNKESGWKRMAQPTANSAHYWHVSLKSVGATRDREQMVNCPEKCAVICRKYWNAKPGRSMDLWIWRISLTDDPIHPPHSDNPALQYIRRIPTIRRSKWVLEVPVRPGIGSIEAILITSHELGHGHDALSPTITRGTHVGWNGSLSSTGYLSCFVLVF